jgi:ankyrin repeat protein
MIVNHYFKLTIDNLNNAFHMLAANGLTSLLIYVTSKIENPRDIEMLLNSQNQAGNTPLHWAIINNKVETAHKLLEMGTNPNLINEKGQTPLDVALMYQLEELIPVLSKQTKLKDTDLDDDENGEIKVVKEKVTSAKEFQEIFPAKQEKK